MAAATGAYFLSAGFIPSPAVRSCLSPSSGKLNLNSSSVYNPIQQYAVTSEEPISSSSSSTTTSSFVESRRLEVKRRKEEEVEDNNKNPFRLELEEAASLMKYRRSLKDYFEEAKCFVRSEGGGCGGPPRWFSPLECSSRLENSPLLLYLPAHEFSLIQIRSNYMCKKFRRVSEPILMT